MSHRTKPEKNAPDTAPQPDEMADMIGNRDQEPNPFERPGDGRGASFGAGGRAHSARTMELLHYDELESAALAALEADPRSADALDLLREAEHFLWTNSPLATLPCPGANELYDYGRGPGYRPLAAGRRTELEAHLFHCPPCRSLSSTLASPPPMPLVIDAPAPSGDSGPTSESEPATHEVQSTATLSARLLKRPRPGPRRSERTSLPLRILRLSPVAAALLVLGLGMSFFGEQPARTVYAPDRVPGPTGTTGTTAGGFPTNPLLRGSGAPERANLLHPRGRLLAPSERLPGGWLLAAAPLFELTPVDRADEYRVVVELLDGSAFSTGAVVLRLAGSEPQLQSSAPLDSGFYRWEATAMVDGLPRDLGAMDFRVVNSEDTETNGLLEELQALDGADRRVIHAVRLLHAAGFRSDARALARTLPASPGRDAFLAHEPGR